MPVSWLLAIKQWRARPLRPALCVCAAIAAVALVVGAGAGFDSAQASLRAGLAKITGLADVHVRPDYSAAGGGLPQKLLLKFRRDPRVRYAAGRLDATVGILFHGHSRLVNAIGVSISADMQLRPARYIQGHPLSRRHGQIVLDSSLANLLHARVGQTMRVTTGRRMPATLAVVGIFRATPLKLLMQAPTCEMSAKQLCAITGNPVRYQVIDIRLKHGVSTAAFVKAWQKRLAPGESVINAHKHSGKARRETHNLTLVLGALVISAGLAAAFIIGSTLTIGLEERVRQFGHLRCIGATRAQLFGVLAIEAAAMIVLGVSLGELLGVALVRLLVAAVPQIFSTFSVSATTIMAGAASGIFATAAGSLIPIWKLSRVSPMEAVRVAASAPRRAMPYVAAAMGAGCLALQALLWQIPDDRARFWVYMFAGVPLIFCGFALLGPLTLHMLAIVFAPVAGAVFRVRRELLRSAWSRTQWRAAVAIAALMMGATMFTGIRARGRGLAASWRFPVKFPDLFLYSAFVPFHQSRLAALPHAVPGVVAVAGVTAFNVRGNVNSPDGPPVRVLYTATQPRRLSNLIQLNFLQGSLDKSLAAMRRGRAIWVGRQGARAMRLHLGSVLYLETAFGPKPFTVAGVIDAPGVEMAKRFFNVRGLLHAAASAAVLGTLADARRYFGSRGVNMLVASTSRRAGQAATLAQVKSFMRKNQAHGFFQSLLKTSAAGMVGASSKRMKRAFDSVVMRVVNALTLIAFGAMAIACVGITNLFIAAAQARKYELGLLRAIGAGRWQLVRMLTAESALLCMAAAALGTPAGLELAYMATLVDHLIFKIPSVFVASVNGILIGVAATFVTGMAATAIPAWAFARKSQSALLAAGR